MGQKPLGTLLRDVLLKSGTIVMPNPKISAPDVREFDTAWTSITTRYWNSLKSAPEINKISATGSCIPVLPTSYSDT